MNAKNTLRVAAAGLALTIFSQPSMSASPPKWLRWYGNGITVIVHSGTKPIPIVAGYNDIDPVRSVNCHSSAGCTITIAATVQVQHSLGEKVCSFVDGVEASPSCIGDNNVTIQMASVSQGTHTFQTKLLSDNSLGNIVGWVAQYTVYDRATP